MRGTTPPPGPATDERFRDVEMPTGLLKALLAAAPSPPADVTREIDTYLSTPPDASGTPVQIVVDAALKSKLADSDVPVRTPVRIYDLKDARAADIRRAIGPLPDVGRAYLLTVKP
jgi:hypothetical protein